MIRDDQKISDLIESLKYADWTKEQTEFIKGLKDRKFDSLSLQQKERVETFWLRIT